MSTHPIIYQISTPRSGSTAALRCFETQGVFEIFHEPSIKPHEFKKRWGLTSFMFRSDHPIDTFPQLESTLLETSKYRPIYVKDIAYSSIDWLKQSSLLTNPQVHFVFLIRNPYDQLVSLCKQFSSMNIPPKMVGDVYDYQLLADLIEVCRSKAPNRTLVMETECLCQYPEKMMNIISNQVGISLPIELTWNPKCDHFDGSEWHESKKPDSFRKWHRDAISSTGFRSLPKYPQDWSQFSDVTWAQRVIAKNSQAYSQIFAPAYQV